MKLIEFSVKADWGIDKLRLGDVNLIVGECCKEVKEKTKL